MTGTGILPSSSFVRNCMIFGASSKDTSTSLMSGEIIIVTWICPTVEKRADLLQDWQLMIRHRAMVEREQVKSDNMKYN